MRPRVMSEEKDTTLPPVRLPGRILIVDDDASLRRQIAWSLKGRYEVLEAGDREEGLASALRSKPDAILLDLHLPPGGGPGEGLTLLKEIRARGGDAAVIVMTGDDGKDLGLRAIDQGATDFFRKPIDLDELRTVVRRALERQAMERENRRLKTLLRDQARFDAIVGGGPAMRRVFDLIRRVAAGETTVIIRGESGTGKELVARAIHDTGDRHDRPFVAVQCSALPEPLIESELFGHERGAFTDAVEARQGRFEAADGGTLFLDEIGTLSTTVQTKLLRAIESRQFERLGGRRKIRVDVRLITATNEDLEARVRDGLFREDLYYRIHVFPIALPPLRDRREDIPALLDHFLGIHCRARGVPVKTIAADAMERIVRHPWRGNVRELANVVQTIILQTDADRITIADLPLCLTEPPGPAPAGPVALPALPLDLGEATDRFEAELLRQAIARAGGVKIEAAHLLGIDKNRMMYLCRKHNL